MLEVKVIKNDSKYHFLGIVMRSLLQFLCTMKKIIVFGLFLSAVEFLSAQVAVSTVPDSTYLDSLKTIVHAEMSILYKKNYFFLPKTFGTLIYAGKKTEIIELDRTTADLSTNNVRQIFSKVPGLSIWENDGSGIQTSIAARGLSPNRSWEFNMRQNGGDISSEAFGYPETYYTPPSESLERIEIIRGAGSLQFGPQLGGVVNYVTKKSLGNKPISIESSQTIGSYGMFNSYNAIGGVYKKWAYYGFFHYRTADGWRENSFYKTRTAYFTASYAFSSRWNLRLDYTNMNNLNQQAGGLADAQWMVQPRSSSRARNWMSTPWNLASATLNYQSNKYVSASLKFFSTIGERNSVGFIKSITTEDTLNGNLGTYNPRQVDRDSYLNFGAELRVLYTYKAFHQKQALSLGGRIYQGHTDRKQQGIGTTGSEYSLELTDSISGKLWGKEMDLTTKNASVYVENLFQLGERISITPGARLEYVYTGASGYISPVTTAKQIDVERNRLFVLFGLGFQWSATKNSNVYANMSQGYRPATFSEQIPSGTTEIVDPNLKDAKGYNVDLGYRGTFLECIRFDVGLFALNYENRIGAIIVDGVPFKTNIGTSFSKGIESLVELDVLQLLTRNKHIGSLQVFVNYTFIDARYTSWNNPVIANDPLLSIEGKLVENAPRHTVRAGLSYVYKSFGVHVQSNFVDEVFTDAANTELPNATATVGKIAAYFVADASLHYRMNASFSAKIGVNNLTNAQYATRRATGYPGPGLLPGNGRTIYLTLSMKLPSSRYTVRQWSNGLFDAFN
jgi:Fe(3+) dicitrate transport protein